MTVWDEHGSLNRSRVNGTAGFQAILLEKILYCGENAAMNEAIANGVDFRLARGVQAARLLSNASREFTGSISSWLWTVLVPDGHTLVPLLPRLLRGLCSSQKVTPS